MKNKILIGIIASSMAFGACKTELLDLAPVTSFSDLTVFDNQSRVDQQIRGLYNTVRDGNFLGGRYYVYHEIRGENFINETSNNVTGLSVWNFTVQPSNVNDVNNLWNTCYLAINRINVFLEGIDANADKLRAQGVTDATLNGYRAEARFLRAVTYFSLQQLYGNPYADGNGSKLGVLLRLTANVSAGPNDLARSTTAQVYDQILEDLNFAETNLPLTRSSASENTTRAHRNSAIAFKTRVYTSMGRNGDVITEANKIVSTSAPFSAGSGVANALTETYAAAFSAPYTTSDNIFSMPFTENTLPGTQNGLGHYFNPGPTGGGEYSMNPAGIIANTAWETDDDRRKMISTAANGKIYWAKFPRGPQHLDYAPVIRYAEVMLNLAEALARTNGVDARALELLNAVRTRANATAYEAGQFASGNDLVEAILLERQIEFLGEGHRGVDLQRLQRELPAKANVSSVGPSSPAYLWPLPQAELLANKAAVQNPGY